MNNLEQQLTLTVDKSSLELIKAKSVDTVCCTINKKTEKMSSDNLQMHQINSSSDATLANSHSNSSASMQKSANIQFVSDSPITDPGQSSKVRATRAMNKHRKTMQSDYLHSPLQLPFFFFLFASV